jgi:hypothetical protein
MLLQRQHLRIINHQHVDRLITATATAATATGSTSSGTSGGCDQ